RSSHLETTMLLLLTISPSRKCPICSKYLSNGAHCDIDMEENLKSVPASPFVNFYRAYDMAKAFKIMGNDNCNRIMTNDEIRKIITSGDKYDLVIVEQFVTDCGLAVAYKVNAPTVGMTAHVLMPWTYSRLGAPNKPAFVPNHLFATGTKPHLWTKVQSAIINLAMNAYFTYAIQRSDQAIVNKIYPEVPDLESLGHNISLVMLNQYFPLTGSRLYGANVIKVGGMHVTQDNEIIDKELKSFLDMAKNSVVYISIGTVASNFPSDTLEEIMAFVQNSKMNFVWKVDDIKDNVAKNLLSRQWLPQTAILCHPNVVVAFISRSGMLSTTAAMHCGVPIVGVPLFGDQFSNADSAAANGLGVVLDIYTLNRKELASRNHDVTVINYFPFKNMTNIRQISIQDESGAYCDINIEENLKSIPAANHFVNFHRAYNMATRLKSMGNDNCQRIMTKKETREMITAGDKYDLVIVEQFVTDCGLAIAYKLNAPTVGITAHILMPWTYPRLGAPNNRSFVLSHDLATGTKSSLWRKIENAIINLAMNAYFTYAIQRSDQAIVNKIYPEVPDLESLGHNISLVMLNQYFPLTGSRLYGANVIEVGGHPNVVAFISHSGMLSTTEAMHCGIPIVGVPLFGDQFSNADSAAANGLGVVLDIYTLNRKVLEEALQTVLQDSFQQRAKELSVLWRDRPVSAMDTAVFWIEYVARHQGRINLKPATGYLDMTEHLMWDDTVPLEC
ncbi:UDP-glycosyltransferase UGT43B1, partial [Operophtera brumata]